MRCSQSNAILMPKSYICPPLLQVAGTALVWVGSSVGQTIAFVIGRCVSRWLLAIVCCMAGCACFGV